MIQPLDTGIFDGGLSNPGAFYTAYLCVACNSSQTVNLHYNTRKPAKPGRPLHLPRALAAIHPSSSRETPGPALASGTARPRREHSPEPHREAGQTIGFRD